MTCQRVSPDLNPYRRLAAAMILDALDDLLEPTMKTTVKDKESATDFLTSVGGGIHLWSQILDEDTERLNYKLAMVLFKNNIG